MLLLKHLKVYLKKLQYAHHVEIKIFLLRQQKESFQGGAAEIVPDVPKSINLTLLLDIKNPALRPDF